MYKKWYFWVILLIVIGLIAFFGYKYYKFRECKKSEGKVCGGGQGASETTETKYQYTKCDFWKGKTCE